MDLSKNINNSFNDVQPADGGNQKKLIDKTYVMMDIYTFQNKIMILGSIKSRVKASHLKCYILLNAKQVTYIIIRT